MKPKRPTDKDLRLYARLSDVDPALVADSAIPEPAPHLSPVTPPARKPSGIRSLLARPWAASLAVSTAMLTLVLAALLAMGGFREPTVESPSHSAHPDTLAPLPGETVSPSLENAAALRKGMSFTELVSLMGNNYTQEGTRYTFTLDTGEQLAVDTEYIYGGTVGSRVTGFEWLGSAGETYNPMGIPAEILQKLQDCATDTVIPVYAMSSLIGQYDSATPPTLDEILKDAEVRYLRTGADGKAVILDEEGHGAGGSTLGDDLGLLANVSLLFDESVRVKAYYPILTTGERGAVYFQTSIGDYILYLHGEAFTLVPEGSEPTLADPVPYLMPMSVFHLFAYKMVDKSTALGIGWNFTEERMAVIEPYKMTAEGYRKPVNIATPEAAEQIKVGMQIDFYGNSLTALLGNGYATMPERMKGLFYWELTDGRGFVVTAKTVESYSGMGDVCAVTSVGYFDSAEMLESLGQPSLANAALIREGVSLVVAEAVMGAHDHLLVPLSVPCVWTWQEEGRIHTLTIDWRLYTTGGGIPQEKTEAGDVTLSKVSESSAAAQVKVGMTRTAIIQLMGKSHSTAEQQAAGILYWKKDKGRSLFVYCRPEDSGRKDPECIVTDIVWLDSPSILNRLGSPSYDIASSLIVEGMSHEAVTSLMGKEISYSYSSSSSLSVSCWTLEANGMPHTFTVYWETVVNSSLQSEKRVQAATLTESRAPDYKPISTLTQSIQIGMTDMMVLNALGVLPTEVFDCGDGILYVWELSDGRYFGAVLENRAPEGVESYRFTVTHTFYWDTAEEIGQPTRANAERITQGMSYAAVIALVGEPDTVRKRNDGTVWSTVHWLTDRNLLSVEIEWHVTRNVQTGTPTYTVYEAVIAVG